MGHTKRARGSSTHYPRAATAALGTHRRACTGAVNEAQAGCGCSICSFLLLYLRDAHIQSLTHQRGQNIREGNEEAEGRRERGREVEGKEGGRKEDSGVGL